MTSEIFERMESNVRSYCRSFPATFKSARNHIMTDVHGRDYVDLLSGAGALNYGHNNSRIRERVVEYMMADGVTHSLDIQTRAKQEFLAAFDKIILQPRGMHCKVQFTGPTGTNAVEAAMKLARKVTGRRNVVAFTGGYHGMSLGSLAATGNGFARNGAGVALNNVIRLPYDGYVEEDALAFFEKALCDGGSGLEAPACFLLEIVQGEGGLRVASHAWLQRIAKLAAKLGSLVIIDDIQAGCGRTGSFFSFEGAGFSPDIVCLSKSIGGIGLPMALVLMKPQHDVWAPGEHNGTFRGNNLAFVAAAAALELYWADDRFQAEIARKSLVLEQRLARLQERSRAYPFALRGRGLMRGLAFADRTMAKKISRLCFERGLIVETCGPNGEVLKLLPALTIPEPALLEAVDTIGAIVEELSTLQGAQGRTGGNADGPKRPVGHEQLEEV